MRHLAAAALLTLAGPTSAEVIAELTHQDARIQLHTDAGPCVGAARWALYTKGPERIPGCWIFINGNTVQIAFLDGDIAQIPVGAFQEPKRL